MSWQPGQQQERAQRAQQRRQERLRRYGSRRVRHFPHNPYVPRLMPPKVQERQAAQKLFGWQIEGIKAALRMYEARPPELRAYSRILPAPVPTESRRRVRQKLVRSRVRSERAELAVRVICLALMAAQRRGGAGYEAREVGTYRNGRLWRWTLPETARLLGEGTEAPSIDQIGDTFNSLCTAGLMHRHQPKENGPAHWKVTRRLLELLGVSKQFDESSTGVDPDFEFYLRQVYGEQPHLQTTEQGRDEARRLANRRLWDAKARPPPT